MISMPKRMKGFTTSESLLFYDFSLACSPHLNWRHANLLSILEQRSTDYDDALADTDTAHGKCLVILAEIDLDRARFEAPLRDLNDPFFWIKAVSGMTGTVSFGPENVARVDMFGFKRLLGFGNSILTLKLEAEGSSASPTNRASPVKTSFG